MFAVTMEGGMLSAFPDVCQTPTPVGPVPIPYPNEAEPPMAEGAAENVLISDMPALNMTSTIAVTMGDTAGVAGGVASGTIMEEARFVEGSECVMIGGSPAVRLTSPTMQNLINAEGACIVPSQEKVVIMS